jgi:hypothetical protein
MSRTMPGLVGVMSSKPPSLMGDGRRLFWTNDHSIVASNVRGIDGSSLDTEKPLTCGKPAPLSPWLDVDQLFPLICAAKEQ